MIRSMTGYGKAEKVVEDRNYQIEIKGVNHRYLDISVKIPKQLSYLEEDIKKEISKKVKRGKIDVFVTFLNNSAQGREIKINTEIAKIYIDELRKLAEQENILSNIEVTEISKYPDVLSIQNTQDEDIIRQEVLEVSKEAIEQFINMKVTEGEKISEDLFDRVKNIQAKIEKISLFSTGLIEEYIVKLEKRIKELVKDQEIDKTRLAQEVVIYADKCSVEEEITRLKSHIFQFEGLLKETSGAIGKKLDFIIQEMNTETNTIRSKANSLEITNEVIDIKTELEDIREQVQNIE